VYTTDENVNLVEVFQAIKSANKGLPSEKDDKAIKAYFKEVYPTMDFERVYTSDMKKMIKWYNAISKHGIEIKLSATEE
jgi:hypothetical protein